jgi:hypothetical protein
MDVASAEPADLRGAVKSGDRDLVLSCLTSQALADLGPDADDLPLGKLQTTIGSFTSYVVEGDVGPYWSIRALRAGARPKWIFLERTGYGEWKVGASDPCPGSKPYTLSAPCWYHNQVCARVGIPNSST